MNAFMFKALFLAGCLIVGGLLGFIWFAYELMNGAVIPSYLSPAVGVLRLVILGFGGSIVVGITLIYLVFTGALRK